MEHLWPSSLSCLWIRSILQNTGPEDFGIKKGLETCSKVHDKVESRQPCAGIAFLTQWASLGGMVTRFRLNLSVFGPWGIPNELPFPSLAPPRANNEAGANGTLIRFVGPWEISLSSDDLGRDGMKRPCRRPAMTTGHHASRQSSREMRNQGNQIRASSAQTRTQACLSEDGSTRRHDNTAEPPARHGGVSQGWGQDTSRDHGSMYHVSRSTAEAIQVITRTPLSSSRGASQRRPATEVCLVPLLTTFEVALQSTPTGAPK